MDNRQKYLSGEKDATLKIKKPFPIEDAPKIQPISRQNK